MLQLNLNAQEYEYQRKYTVVHNEDSLKAFIKSSDSIGQFHLYFHAKAKYFDLYLDTPDQLLLNLGLSLRLRKRILPNDQITYTFQLKNEMTTSSSLRFEVEESELDFYKIKVNHQWHTLSALLDQLFSNMNNWEDIATHPVQVSYYQALMDWFVFKADAPIAPFQKLKTIYPGIMTSQKIGSLKPVLIGVSERYRSHIYLPKASEILDLEPNPLNALDPERPIFFKAHPQYIWLMESSLDYSTFYPLFRSNRLKHQLVEYECEVKLKGGTLDFINQFEAEIRDCFRLKKQINSKYRQTMWFFND